MFEKSSVKMSSVSPPNSPIYNCVNNNNINNDNIKKECGDELSDNHKATSSITVASKSTKLAQIANVDKVKSMVCESPNVDDGLTSLSWLQNLNIGINRLGSSTPLTPPASPVWPSHSFKSPTSYGLKIKSSSSSYYHHHSHHQHMTSSSNRSASSSSSSPSSSFTSSSTTSSYINGSRERRFNAHHQNGFSSSSSSSSSSFPAASNNHNTAKRTLPRVEEMIDFKTNGSIKPPYSYATLICMAMKANKNKMTLSAIYRWIKENFLYYQKADPSWQVRRILIIFNHHHHS